jgi:GntR family transcriptional regulator/MocR family aminotransferase
MPKDAPSAELTLGIRSPGMALPRWLYQELRRAILSGRLRRGSRVPASRELARQHGVSRGTVVTAFDQLLSEGYLSTKVGAGTFVNVRLPQDLTQTAEAGKAESPSATRPQPSLVRPFRAYEPGLNAFPIDLWARTASRRLRKASQLLLASGDPSGYAPLREAVADYLGRSRGVVCTPDQVLIVASTNQSLDLAARILIQPGDSVWMEDPGYPGATAALRAAKARLVPVPVDDRGLDPAVGQRLAPRAKAVYLTPAHQFPLGVTMPLDRRLAILEWARRSGAHILEDDYDSEYRYGTRPIPALQGLDPRGSVIFMGSFSKALFTSLRLAYLIVPDRLIDPLRSLRLSLDRFSPSLDQAILCDFIAEGHFSRHLRRMRDLYAERLQALRDSIRRYLQGAVELPAIEAGLHIPAHLRINLRAGEIEESAARQGVETMSLGHFSLKRKDLNGLLLGFAAFDARAIRRGVEQLAAVIESWPRAV